jgi:hypothetical protein
VLIDTGSADGSADNAEGDSVPVPNDAGDTKESIGK